jgi:hypothetical protein
MANRPFGRVVNVLVGALAAASAALLPLSASADDGQAPLLLSERSFATGDWSFIVQGQGPTAVIDETRLKVTLPADSSQSPLSGIIQAGAASRCQVRGDFDMSIRFRLTVWPSNSGVQVLLGDGQLQDIVARSSEPAVGPETYLAFFPPYAASVSTTDISGKLRLARTGATVSGYYLSDDGWARLLTAPAQTGDAYIVFFAWSNDNRFQHQEVQATFSDFRLARGQLICP